MTRTPVHRRGVASVVDYENLADLVRRRCVGCAPDFQLALAVRFLEQAEFPPEDIQQVLAILEKRFRRERRRQPSRVPSTCSMNGSVICDHCRQRMADHPRDIEDSELRVTCDGRRVRLCL